MSWYEVFIGGGIYHKVGIGVRASSINNFGAYGDFGDLYVLELLAKAGLCQGAAILEVLHTITGTCVVCIGGNAAANSRAD